MLFILIVVEENGGKKYKTNDTHGRMISPSFFVSSFIFSNFKFFLGLRRG